MKPIIYDLYYTRNIRVQDVADILEQVYMFKATSVPLDLCLSPLHYPCAPPAPRHEGGERLEAGLVGSEFHCLPIRERPPGARPLPQAYLPIGSRPVE